MIRISEKIDIAAPPGEVWSILHDPAAVAGCIPGAELKAEIGPGLYEAAMSVKFGPTVAHFSGEARVEYDEAARRCTVSGRGNDKKGMSPTTGSGAISVTGEATTALTIDGSFEVSGPLESFVETGGVFVARALLAQFAKNVGALVQNRQAAAAAPIIEPSRADATPAPSALPVTSAAAVPLSASGLLRDIIAERFRALLNWILRRR